MLVVSDIHERVTSHSSYPQLTELMKNEGGSTLAERDNNETRSNLLSYQSTLSQSQPSCLTLVLLLLLLFPNGHCFLYVMAYLEHTRKVVVADV